MQQNPDQSTVLLLVKDLIFETKIRSTARTLGIDLKTARSAADVGRAITDTPPSLIIIDLNGVGDAVSAVEVASRHDPRPTILAYVSHVDTALFAQARNAGADHVLPRSRFNQELPRILAELAPRSPETRG